MGVRGRKGRLLLSTSVAALVIGGGAPAAFACAHGAGAGAGFDNPAGHTTACVVVTNTSFTGNITNEGTITPGGPTGILVTNASTITGQVSNSGTIAITTGTGIRVTANSVITNGIVNSGTISMVAGSGIVAIKLDALSSFAGGITNSGTIAGPGVFHTGISVANVATFSGGIVNGGALTASGFGIDVTGGGSETFLGGISNSGSIRVAGGGGKGGKGGGAGDIGIAVNNLAVFGDGIRIASSASISTDGIGISVQLVSTFTGGISNSGSIRVEGSGGGGGSGKGDIGIAVNNLAVFGGGISIASTGSISTDGTGISVSNVANFTGGISNGGTISADIKGISVVGGGGTFANGIANSGTVSTTHGGAIDVSGFATFSSGITNSGLIAAASNAAIRVTDVSAFSGGIVNNHGSISAGANGIQVGLSCSHGCVSISTFAGGITNSGSIAAGGFGMVAMGVGTFSDGILNSGTIAANIGIGVGFVRPNHPPTTTSFVMAPVATFAGGVTNSGTITAGSAGVWVMAASSFAGGITNAAGGVITAQNGIRVGFGLTSSGAYAVSNFSGGITNHGLITAAGLGISVGNVSTFGGRISNSGTIVAHSGGGIQVNTVGTFSGGISNSGAILGDGVLSKSRGAIYVGSVSAFDGGITNSGTISAGPLNGISVEFVNSFSGGISNSGAIQGDATFTKRIGVIHIEVDVFDGGVSNSGTLTGVNGGIYVLAGTFLGGITNSGRISAQTAIIVDSVASFDGHIANSGTISASNAAIDLTRAATAITIDQNAGLIAGNILLSPNGDTLNVHGGTISGNVGGQNNGDTVNFALGSGSFTYAAPFAMTGLSLVNFNSGTAFVDGSIQATTLAVNSGGTAAGTGTLTGALTVMAGGTLMPGDVATPLGTLAVTGNLTFNAGSFYAVHVSQATASATTIGGATGTVTISGGTVLVTLLQPGSYNQTYTIVTANGGRSGTFSGIQNTNATFNGTESLSYDATHVFLTLAGNATLGAVTLTTPGPLSVNPQNVFNGINNFILPGNLLPPGFQNLYNLSGPGLANALTHLAGENNAGVFQGAFQAGNSFLGLMVNPFLDGRFGTGGGFGAAIGFAAEEPPALPQAAAAFASAMPANAAPATATFEQRFSVWGAAYGGSGRVLGDPVLGSHDTSASAAAFAAGVDYRLSPDTLVGFALAGGGTSWNVTAGLGGGHSDMFQAGAYASHHWGAAYLSAALAYNFHDVTTNRTVTVAGTDMLQARFQANGVGARLEGGYRYATSWVGITPYAAAQVQSIALPNYGETATAGSNQFALNFASQTATTTRTELGAWLDRKMRMDSGALLTLYGRAAWAHDFGNSPSASAIFQALPGSNFVVNGATPARDGALVTGAAQYSLASGWSFLAKFDGEFSSTTSIYAGTGGVRKTW